jgi:isocitrate dehydrogenase kinase/phosphatase
MSQPTVSIETAIAQTILDGFNKHYRLFRDASAQAKQRFERAEWKAGREAMVARIQMYDKRVEEAVQAVRAGFPAAERDEALWPQIKLTYIALLNDHLQPELAETFYNSVACSVLHRRYYRNQYIFWRPAVSTEHLEGAQPTYRCYYPSARGMRRTLLDIVTSFELANAFEDLRRDVRNLLGALNKAFTQHWHPQPNFQIQVLSSLFYRNKGAYVVGRAINGSREFPFVVALLQNARGELYADALLLDPAHLAVLFSFARAYFMVDMEVPSAYVGFLRSLLPDKPLHEVYTVLGLQKHGKTLFYRDLHHHLKHSSDNFVVAPGIKGMVMAVFTLPSFPYVFKMIRDHFVPPKDTDKKTVKEKYLLVKYHDRVGRLADTLEYSNVAFPLRRFDPALLQELQALAASNLEVEGDELIIKHLYIERRMVPLNLYLQHADERRLQHGVREFGQAIKDLAGANIFPGDLLPKNFGVTRHGRVVFYDYDEIVYMRECSFRRIPLPRTPEDEMSHEPWYDVAASDVFPEQFATFLFTQPRAREAFMRMHGDLAAPEFWVDQQERLAADVQEDVFPYPDSVRLPRAGSKFSNAIAEDDELVASGLLEELLP